MTLVGAGGIRFSEYSYTNRFKREYRKLGGPSEEIEAKLRQLLTNPFPSGLRFEKLKGYSKPDVYTIHIDGNYKVSMAVYDCVDEIKGKDVPCKGALLRRIATHNEIDRSP